VGGRGQATCERLHAGRHDMFHEVWSRQKERALPVVMRMAIELEVPYRRAAMPSLHVPPAQPST